MKMLLNTTECSKTFDSLTGRCGARHDVARDGGGEIEHVVDGSYEDVRHLTTHHFI
jgi:hypothetical protein